MLFCWEGVSVAESVCWSPQLLLSVSVCCSNNSYCNNWGSCIRCVHIDNSSTFLLNWSLSFYKDLYFLFLCFFHLKPTLCDKHSYTHPLLVTPFISYHLHWILLLHIYQNVYFWAMAPLWIFGFTTCWSSLPFYLYSEESETGIFGRKSRRET